MNHTLVLLGAAAILGAIITQPSALGHRYAGGTRAVTPLVPLDQHV